MQSFAIRAPSSGGFRLTLDLSAWAAVGVSLAPAILRLQARKNPGDTPQIEFATGSANPVTFDPETGLAVFSAPATATAGLKGVYAVSARAEYATSELPLFGGSVNFFAGASNSSTTTGLPAFDTAFIASHPFGPAPIPPPIAAAVAAAQAAAREALLRGLIYGY